MNIKDLKLDYERKTPKKEGQLLRFEGVQGRDVYNCSVPFEQNGKLYVLGRVEKRSEWANSTCYLFEQKADGVWYKVPEFDALPIEDPFYTEINGESVVIGTHVLKECGKVKTYYGYFYRGKDIFNLKYFTTGPSYMKDIRLVQLPEGRVGIFSRPRSEEIKKKYGSESRVGYTVVSALDDITADIIQNANYIENFFEIDEWGGVNQAFYLAKHLIGVIGHQCYADKLDCGGDKAVYINTAYVVDVVLKTVKQKQIIATRRDYPEYPSKTAGLTDCAFTSGVSDIVNPRVKLYSGLSDSAQGVVEIDNPFVEYLNLK